MAETPNNDIEKQLRDYAAHRREAAGTPEMHPATRQMLQAEVKQQFGGTMRPARPRGWLVFWPRLATVLSVLAIVAVAMVVINKQPNVPKRFELAEASEPVTTPRSATAPALPPETALKKATGEGLAVADRADGRPPFESHGNDKAEGADVAKDLPATPLAAAVPAAGPAVTTSETRTVLAKGGRDGRADPNPPTGAKLGATATSAAPESQLAYQSDSVPSEVINAAAQQPIPAAAQGQQAQFAVNTLNSITQRFRNTESSPPGMGGGRGGGGGAPAQVVLDEFMFAQNGGELKIVDRDGSVYNGYVRVATDAEASSNLNYYANNTRQFAEAAPALKVVGPDQTANSRVASNIAVTEASTAVLAGTGAQAQNWSVPQNYMFEVEGTNRSLRQRVVFNGNLIQNTGTLSVQSGAQNAQNFQNYRRQEQSLPLQNAVNQQLQNNYINGRVYLGNSRSGTELNALSTDQ